MTRSQTLFDEAKQYIPGGVNSSVRAFSSVGGDPVFIRKAAGAYLYDVDDNRYIDYVASWGPMILGHAHPEVIRTVTETAQNGLSFGAPTELETQLAKAVCEKVPSIERVRMVNSGTEATMSAVRLARGFTGRDKVIKFEGCYHGHGDSFLIKAGSGALTQGVPTSPGVPAALAEHTFTPPFNDSEAVEELMKEHGDGVAAIIVEPVAGNMNCVPPADGFLQTLRELCDRHGSALIFDEVMTGFRVALGGAQSLYKVQPDLTTLGKIIGGGMPVGAFGGRRDIMEHISPTGPVYQAGTLSGNPVAMAAGLKTLELVSQRGFYDALTDTTRALVQGIKQAADKAGVAMTYNQVGAMFGLFFTESERVASFADVGGCNTERFAHFFREMLKRGIYLAPSAFEAGFVSSAHSDEDISRTIEAARDAFKALKG